MLYVGAQLDDELQKIYGRNTEAKLHMRRLVTENEDCRAAPPGPSWLSLRSSAAVSCYSEVNQISDTAAIRPTAMATRSPSLRGLALKIQPESSKRSCILIYEGQILMTAKLGNAQEPLAGGVVPGRIKLQPESRTFLPCQQDTADCTGAPVLAE